VLEGATDSVTGVDGSIPCILTASVDGHVRCYDIRKGLITTDELGAPVTSALFLKDRLAYLATCLDAQMRLMDSETGVPLQTYAVFNENFRIKPAIAKNDSLIVAGDEKGNVLIWDLFKGELLRRENICDKSISCVDVKNDLSLATSTSGVFYLSSL
jgi:mitogen-activated protein kinase organizer 1